MNTLVVKNLEGKDITINVVDIIEDTETKKNFICYTIGNLEDIFISLLVEKEDGYVLDTVTEEEKQNIEQVLAQDASEE